MDIVRHWRLRKQRYSLEGIDKVDQANGVGLAHMSSSLETIAQVKKNFNALKQIQEQQDLEDLAVLRKAFENIK